LSKFDEALRGDESDSIVSLLKISRTVLRPGTATSLAPSLPHKRALGRRTSYIVRTHIKWLHYAYAMSNHAQEETTNCWCNCTYYVGGDAGGDAGGDGITWLFPRSTDNRTPAPKHVPHQNTLETRPIPRPKCVINSSNQVVLTRQWP
jgi:hypothetical protein